MKRYVSMDEISDGRLYGPNDMVKADCHQCSGCSQCCYDCVDTIILSPIDACRMSLGLQKPFYTLVEKEVQLQVVDGIVLPNVMREKERGCCVFLDAQGRCSIHAFRPDLCRLFPLGRYYENGDFKYFLQVGQCAHPRTKVKVSKWIDTPNQRENKGYVLRWHDLLNRMEEVLAGRPEDDFRREFNLEMLRLFYMEPYDTALDFYSQFAGRAEIFEKRLAEESR